jgi:hypothetical protein
MINFPPVTKSWVQTAKEQQAIAKRREERLKKTQPTTPGQPVNNERKPK